MIARGCILPLVALGCFIGGAQGIYTVLTNREPKVYDIDQYLAKRPTDKWVRITGGRPDFADATYLSSRLGTPRVTEVFLPVRSLHESRKAKVKILLATKQPEIVEAIEITKALKPEQAASYVMEHAEALLAPRDIEGLIRFGIETKDKEERQLREVSPNLAEDCVILDEGKKPNALASVYLLAAGVGLTIWFVARARSSGNGTPSSLTPPPMPRPPPLPPSDPPLRQS